MMGLFAGLVSILTYKSIIQRQGSIESYMMGYGVLMPFFIILPYYQVALFDCQNLFMKFCFAVIVPVINLFHIPEGALQQNTEQYWF